MYAIRHGFITRALYAGVPIFALARHCGTSTQMIERTYGHVIAQLQSKAIEVLDAESGV